MYDLFSSKCEPCLALFDTEDGNKDQCIIAAIQIGNWFDNVRRARKFKCKFWDDPCQKGFNEESFGSCR